MQRIDSLDRLRSLFRELFQLDLADLDFGLYRILRLKRDEIDEFLDVQLPAEVSRGFEAAVGSEREALQQRMNELAERARESVDDAAILPNGNANPAYASAKSVKEYVEARARVQAVEVSEAQQIEVFNLLYAFFSRYYIEGDFIPRRFYGARPSYAVPYNGDEVFFHWANQDQYYVKTGEVFRDYAFAAVSVNGEYRVRFKLVEATVPKDNTKGETRFFFPLLKQVTLDEDARTLTVPFEYRLPTEAEVTKYGKNAKGQETILDEASPRILRSVPNEFLAGVLATSAVANDSEEERPLSLLRRRLSHFTKRNTTDYFLHKNLDAFLRQELEFFVRDQVVDEADLEGDFEAKRRIVRVFRQLAGTVITFLTQIEDAQRRLFEKRKFVLRADYVVTVQHVPRTLWREVLANEPQLREWKELFGLAPKSDVFKIKTAVNERVLEQNPTLPVDTRHFSLDFVARLVASVEDLDEATDGVVVQGENFQAISFLLPRYRGQLQSIYIDPPYNSDASPIDYKNGYKTSSWLALIRDRVTSALSSLVDEGILCVTIDDVEVHHLKTALEQSVPDHELLGTVVIKNNPAGRTGTVGFSICHEYALFYGRSELARVGRLEHTETQKARYKEHDEIGPFEWTNFRKHGGLNTYRTARPRQFYPIYIQENTIRIPKMEWNNSSRTWSVLEDPAPGEEVLLPIDEAGRERIWDFVVDTARQYLPHFKVRKDSRGATGVYRKWRLNEEGLLPQTIWDKSEYSAAEYGTNLLTNIFGETHKFKFPKSVHAVADCLRVANLRNSPDGMVLDYFAGSGTTGHAVINLNREDGGHRKFVLVEVGSYFDTVLLPRLKKIIFTPDWKQGKPARLPTTKESNRSPRLVKVLRLESYEDALHNAFSDSSITRVAARETAYRNALGDEEFRIRYLLQLSVDSSDSMLNFARLDHPFEYTLQVLSDEGVRTETVDLVETFNWLYGLRVHRMLTVVNEKDRSEEWKKGRLYRVVLADDRAGKKRILVVWRDVTELNASLERPFLEATAQRLGPFEEQWINGDSGAKDFASLDALFRRLMEEAAR
jgi:adenine-specific DNA-methyltransferase